MARTLLVVDDDKVFRESLADVLRQEGFAVVLAGNGAEAMEVVRRAPVDLVLLDLAMPVMDGAEFLKAFRALPTGKNVPVILVTMLGDGDQLEQAQNLGVIGCFSKGHYSVDALLGCIKGMILP